MSTFYLMKTKWWAGPYWVEDDGDRWLNYAGGYISKHKDDKVFDTCEAEKLCELDWSRTALLETQTSCGWLSPWGDWYGCSSQNHRLVAQWVIKSDEQTIEQSGWIRVWKQNDWTCALRGITEPQRSWLESNLHAVDETEWGRL